MRITVFDFSDERPRDIILIVCFKFGFIGDARDAPGDTFEKVPPRPPSKLFGKKF
jgi:hypothetical protein